MAGQINHTGAKLGTHLVTGILLLIIIVLLPKKLFDSRFFAVITEVAGLTYGSKH